MTAPTTNHAAPAPHRPIADIMPPRKEIPAPPHRAPIVRWLRRRRLPAIAILVLALVVVGGALWLHHTPMSGSAEVVRVEQEVGRHYLLPAGEQPVLATVEDEKQITAPFLKQAKNGDKVLIYADAKVVIIYRPSIDRIVAVGPVQITPQNSNGVANQ